MSSFTEFFSFTDPNVRYVAFGSMLITGSSALVGTFTFLSKKSLSGDAIAHAVLPGICLGFLVSGTKNPFYLILGAFVTGWLALQCITIITSRSRIKEDTAIGIVLSVFFGFGILLLTFIQKGGNANQSGLDHFLFGKAAALVSNDLFLFASVAVLLIIFSILFLKEFQLIIFDRNYALSIGIPIKKLDLLLTSMLVLAVVIGIQAVGVVLMAAVLITPAAVARFWTGTVGMMLFISALVGAFSGLAGAYISYLAPSMPTGPWIVIVVSILAILSFFMAPTKGIISRYIKQKVFQKIMQDENILKTLYHLGEAEQLFSNNYSIEEITAKRNLKAHSIFKSLKRLNHQGYVEKNVMRWSLTEEGKNRAQRIVKIHRLWEVYLTTHVKIAPDHVHEDADTIEHFLTPELEADLEKLLNYPIEDPHKTPIPYS
jgi:manganese/zinc/iron transport system permease protein